MVVKELLTPDRIQLVNSVASWEEGITLAARPLLQDGSVTADYIQAMVDSVRTHGPYIVLADRFALAHAQCQGCVSRVALSMLQVRETVDLLGKPVNIFLVLATPDGRSHMQALSSLITLLYNPDHITTLAEGTVEQILEIMAEIE